MSTTRFPQELFGQDAQYLGFNLRASGNNVFAHSLFKRLGRYSAAFGELERGNPDVRVQNDNHRWVRLNRRAGLSLRTSLIRRGTSASVKPEFRLAAYSPISSSARRACWAQYVRKAS